jgi:hypothetical protein
MRVRHVQAREIEVLDDGDIASWTAEHDGYASFGPPTLLRRWVLLDRASRSIDVIDQVTGDGHDVRLAFHLGPEVQAELDGPCAILRWHASRAPSAAGEARLELPSALRWSLHRGQADPILGWYSPGLGGRVPAFTLLGSGRCAPGAPLPTRLEFIEAAAESEPLFSSLIIGAHPTRG